MSADPAQRRQLGELLVEKGVLTDAQLQVALEEQRRSGAPLGEILVQLGFSIGPTVGNALAEQHGGPLRTEYGFALGLPSTQSAQAKDRATVARPKPAEPTPEQDMAIARLTAALNERTQELERARTELDALERHEAEPAIAAADLELLQRELVELREERTRGHQALEVAVGEHQAELAALKAELVAANGERTEHDDRVRQLEDQLAQARVEHDDLAENQGVQAELRRALEQRNAELATASGNLENVQRELVELREARMRAEQALEEHKTELAAVKVELVEVHGERAGHGDRVRQLEDQLTQVRVEHDDLAENQGVQAELRRALEQRNAELATASGNLENVQRELVELREARMRAEQALEEHKTELAAARAELVAANGERAGHDDRVRQLEDQLTQARVELDDHADTQGAQAELRRALELRNAELATASGDLEHVHRELVELREQSTRAHQTLELALEEHTTELAAVRTELAEVHGERAGHDDHVLQLQDYVRQLEDELAQAHSQQDDRKIKGAQAELRLALEQRNAELAQLQEERTVLAYRAAELERELELASAPPSDTVRIQHDPRDLSEGRALHADEQVAQERIEDDVTDAVPREQSALVAAAVARAQRRYGPPIRMTPAEAEAGGGNCELQDTLEAENRAVDTDLPAANPITIRLWQLALFIVLVPSLLYVLAPLTGMVLAAAVVLLAAVVVVFGQRRLSRAGKSPSRKPADRATATPPVPHQG